MHGMSSPLLGSGRCSTRCNCTCGEKKAPLLAVAHDSVNAMDHDAYAGVWQ